MEVVQHYELAISSFLQAVWGGQCRADSAAASCTTAMPWRQPKLTTSHSQTECRMQGVGGDMAGQHTWCLACHASLAPSHT